MKILDRYIVKSIIIVFLCTLLIFLLLYLLIDSASQLDEFIDRKVPVSVLVTYYVNYLPIIIVQTAFYAFLIAALLVYTNLNMHNEVIVLRASGMNFWQITKPALCLALIVSAFIFYVNERMVPEAESFSRQIRKNYMVLEIDRKRKKQSDIKNLTFYGLKNRLFFIDTFNPNTYDLDGITIIEFDNKQTVLNKMVALKGKWTGIAWKFYDCNITEYPPSGINQATSVKVYKEKLVDVKETPRQFMEQRINPNAMNIQQLIRYIEKFRNSGAERVINNLTIDLYQKIAFPVGNIVIVLVGLPFALMIGRRKAQTFVALGLAMAIGFFYHLTNVVFVAMGKGGLFSPLVATWITPALFLAIAFYLIKTRF